MYLDILFTLQATILKRKPQKINVNCYKKTLNYMGAKYFKSRARGLENVV
jgi:hypothetical protein